jgi:hypothetical protein
MKLPIYDRQEKEGAKAFAAARLYFEQGPERSLASVAQAKGKPLSLINRWSGKWQWVVRARAFDEELDKELDKERRRAAVKLAAAKGRDRAKQAAEIRENGSALAQELIQKSREIVRSPLYKQETKDGKITVVPTGWLFKDAVTLGETGIKLGLSLSEVGGDQSDFRDERFEHVDFPPEEEEEK